MPPTYRERLRIEGFTLAGCGALGAILLLVLTGESTRMPLGTVAQLAVVAGLLAYFGARAARRALRSARAVEAGALGSGEPTPLWHLPLIVAGLTTAVGALGGWDAGLRVAGGCLLVGLHQALVLERRIARAEQSDGRTYHRIAGSRIGRGTRLGFLK